MKLTITHKISLLSSLLVALTAGAVAFAFYVNTSNTMAKHALEDLSVHTRNEGEHFLGKIEEIIKDIHFLSNMPPIQELMRTNHSIVYDKNGGASQVQWEQRLATIFSTLMHAHPDYMQVRFLDAQGYEQVRVERNQTGSIENISNNHLQYKGDTDYVKQTTRLQKNKIYLSEINLNREHGKVMIPHTPVLRAATPVYNNSGKLFGIVIINLNLKNEFKRLYHHHQQQGHTLYMMNDKGEFLIHPDKEKRFTFDLGNKHK
ncbi:MAG: PDC sensor domain-containing protein, partial [Gammaproteobacteria bacterium]|nr:PDC sensor domain-containing protein [Gammaproteobacteria bacterium]